MIDALLEFGRQAHLPIAIEYVDVDILHESVGVTLHEASLADVLTAIIATNRAYSWTYRKGMVAISHKAVGSAANSLLDKVLPEFSIPRSSTQEASHALWMTLNRELRAGPHGVIGNYNPGSINNPIGPLKMRNVTVREVLNELVSERKDAAWVVQVPPRYRDQLPPGGLWIIFEYDDPGLQYAGALVRQNLLKYGPPTSTKTEKPGGN